MCFFYLAVGGRQIKSPPGGVWNAYMRSILNRLLAAQTLAQQAEGMRLVIQSPPAIGSQEKTSLCDPCVSAVKTLPYS